jgi:hypothetical protein
MLRRVFCKLLLVAVVVFGLLALSGVLLAQGRSENGLARAIEVQERNTERLMAIEGVVGTAVGLNPSGHFAVDVLLERPGIGGIPQQLEDVPVHPVVTGKIYALPKPDSPGHGKPGGGGGGGGGGSLSPTDRWPRPVPIGVSTGNEGECSAGTIACRVKNANGVYVLSNNHVLALENSAQSDSLILQPGRYDSDPQCAISPDDTIGTLFDFEPILFLEENPSNTNTIDAAIAKSSTNDLGKATPSDGYGTPQASTAAAYVNQRVQKYGRTTGLTKGQVWATNLTVDVLYSSGTARFVDQIMVVNMGGGFILPGDSGSLLVSDGRGKSKGQPVGLLFAGDEYGIYGIANPIDLVLDHFGVAVDGK